MCNFCAPKTFGLKKGRAQGSDLAVADSRPNMAARRVFTKRPASSQEQTSQTNIVTETHANPYTKRTQQRELFDNVRRSLDIFRDHVSLRTAETVSQYIFFVKELLSDETTSH